MTANALADEGVFESAGDGGISLLTPDANISRMFFATPSDTAGAFLFWDFTNNNFQVASGKTGAALNLASGNNVVGLTLDSSQNANFPNGTVSVGGTAISDASANLASANGVAAYGPAAVASITIVNGIVTAVS